MKYEYYLQVGQRTFCKANECSSLLDKEDSIKIVFFPIAEQIRAFYDKEMTNQI